MAEFVLGLTKTAVEGTVSRVKAAIEEEAELRVRVQEDLVFITGEFEMMRSFLAMARAERNGSQLVLRTWVRQLRDLAFDVEDCLEFVVHLENASRWDWMRRLASSLVCVAGPPSLLDVAVAEIKRLKARVEDISQRNTRYNLIGSDSDSSSRPVMPAEQPPVTDAVSALHALRDVWKAAGKMRRGTGDLRKLISSQRSDLEVISLWASPGSAADLGAVHVMREAYNDLEICEEFKCRAWVKLMHPFNPDDFLNNLLAQFYSASSSDHRAIVHGSEFRKLMRTAVSMEDDLMKAELMQKVSDEQRYLIILEDLSAAVEWDTIRMYLSDSKNGSRIVLATTQKLGLALSCTGEPYQVSDLGQFSDGQSLYALSRRAPEHDKGKKKVSRNTREYMARVWTNESELVGRQDEGNDLGQYLQNPSVTAVWGIPGVGKSDIVRSIYYGRMLGLGSDYWSRNGLSAYNMTIDTKKYSWVHVPYPFNLTDLSWRLLLDLHSDDLQAKESAVIGMMEGQDPIQRCRSFLHKDKCFVVLDGVRSTHDWDLIKAAFLSEPTTSRIVVITTEASVATYCADEKGQVLNVKGLEADSMLHLFMKIVAGGKEFTPDEMDLSKLIVAKCGGLPGVIVSISTYCSGPVTPSLKDINIDLMSILETGPGSQSLRGLFSWMQSYLDACSDSVKPCVFYLPVFPSEHDIRRKRLLRRWTAEGYSRDIFGCTAEKGAEKLFSELVELSIIQQPNCSKAMCQVNGFLRAYILSRPMEDNLVFELEGHCSPNSQRAGQHLTISSSWDRDKIVFESMDLSRLRSFTVFGEWRSFFISTDVKMRLLRVLDLEDITSGLTDGDIEQIVKQLPRLKFLSLRGCKDITRLPESLGGLRQLQTLDIRHTKIVTLPRDILKLVKLQYVRAGTCEEVRTLAPREDGDGDGTCTSIQAEAATTTANGEARTSTPWIRPRAMISFLSKLHRYRPVSAHDGVQFPPAAVGIGKLTALHTLGVVNLSSGAGGKAILKDLKKLTQLRKLGVSGIDQEKWPDLCSAISGHAHLASLSVHLDKEEPGASFFSGSRDMFSDLPKTLQSLKLYAGDGDVHVSPILMKQLCNLRKVHLELAVSTQEDIDSIMELPNQDMFRHVLVKPIQDGELRYGRWEGWWTGDCFFEAPILKIHCGSYRLAIVFGDWIPTWVEVLVVHCSTRSSLEVSGLGKLLRLKEVWLKGAYSEAVKQHLQQKVAEHRGKPVLKLDGDQTHQSSESKGSAPSTC